MGIRGQSMFAICFALFNSINILYIFMIAANSVKLLPESLHTPREVYVVSVCVLMNNATRTCEKRSREKEKCPCLGGLY